VLVGENDGGKTAIIDGIRLCLLSSSTEYVRVVPDDFHCGPQGRATDLSITCMFKELSSAEAGVFAEFLTAEVGQGPLLYVTLRARVLDPLVPHRISTSVRAGKGGEGAVIDGNVRELLRTTYLRPLRDAEAALRAGRGSRLAQILHHYPDMQDQAVDDFHPDQGQGQEPQTLVGILKRAEHGIENNDLVKQARLELDDSYLSQFTIGNDHLKSHIGVATSASLQHILERLELTFATEQDRPDATRRGLGYNNALFMAAELLLLGKHGPSPILLIEEPEAHLHPQLQSRVMKLLAERAKAETGSVQIIATTHSPHIASTTPVECLTIVSHGRTYPLAFAQTGLDECDYAFLARFLDATKANLFFARAVAIVEGDAEVILLPALAAAAGYSFNSDGVSVVNVGHTGLFRYSRIFQRADGQILPIPVACIRDRDIVPLGIDPDLRRGLPSADSFTETELEEHLAGLADLDGQGVKTFIAGQWTLEYDLARASWPLAIVMHQAVSAAAACVNAWPTLTELQTIFDETGATAELWQGSGRSLENVAEQIFKPLRRKNSKVSKSVTAQHAAHLLASTNTKLNKADLPPYLGAAFDHLCGDRR
jgi:putative ATP-dependent endonuclease of the OLD family